VEPVASTPAPATRGKSTDGGGAAKRLTTLFRAPSAFAASARFATDGSEPSECFGLIGKDGQRFCILKGCGRKHRGGVFEADPNHLYIKSSATEAFCSPSVDAAKVSTGQVAELMSLSKPVSEWVDVFGVLESAEEVLPLEEVERKLEFLAVAQAHKTPKKAVRSPPSAFRSDDLDLMLEPVPEEILKGSDFDWSKTLPNEFVDALAAFGRTVSSLSSAVPTALSDAAVKAEKENETVSDAIDQLNARLISVECATGARREGGDGLPPTLWEAVAALWVRSVESVSPSQPGGEGLIPNKEWDQMAQALDAMRVQISRANDGSLAVARGLDTFQERVNRLFGLVSQKLTDVVTVQNETTNELSRVAGMTGGSAKAGGSGGGLDSLLASLGSGPPGGDDSVETLRKEVAALRDELARSKDKANETVKIGGLQFERREDLGAWLAEQAPGLPIGTIVDYHALMQQVHYDMGGYESVDSIMKGLKLRSDVGFETTADVLALAAIRRSIPALLGEGKPATGEDRSSFNGYHTFADWKNINGRDGLANTLPASQQQARNAVEADIETR
jgi:hypothetical protein